MAGKWFQQSKGIAIPDDMTGDDGQSYYVYFGFSDDGTATGFNADTPVATSKYISFKKSTTVITTPAYSDFTGWTKFVGDDGAATYTDEYTAVDVSTGSYAVVLAATTPGYVFYGTYAGDYTITVTGTPVEGRTLHLIWLADLSGNTDAVKFQGATVMANVSTTGYYPCQKSTNIWASYVGTAWVIKVHPSFSEVGVVTGAMIVDATVTNAKLEDATMTVGGVTLTLGATDATPAFDLADAINVNVSSPKTGSYLPVINGGTGLTAVPTGLIYGTGSAYSYKTLVTSVTDDSVDTEVASAKAVNTLVQANTGWKLVSDVTARTSYNTFTSADTLEWGSAVKIIGSSTVYGIISSDSSRVYTFAGPDIPSGTIAVYTAVLNKVVTKEFTVPSTFATSPTDTLISDKLSKALKWDNRNAVLVRVSCYAALYPTTDTCTIKAKIGSNYVNNTTGIVINKATTWINSEEVGSSSDINSSNYSIAYDGEYEVAVTASSADVEDLTVILTFVLTE